MTIAELSVRLSVSGQGALQSALDKTKNSLQQVATTARSAGSALTSGFGSQVAALAGAAGIGLLAKSAFDSAVSFESLNARLEAITGSGDRAAKILETVRKVAEPSPFTFNQLATAATQLEAFGLKTEAILPRLANLGAAFGASEENLKSLVNLFGRLAAGNFPDIEQLSAFGLSKSMFAQQGIKFDAGGSLVSSARDTFDALLRIVDTKYATILDKMSKTTESKLASLQDKWEGAMRSLGAGLIQVLSPVIDYFTKFLDKLTTSGAMGDLVNRFLSPFKGFTEALTNGDAQAAVDRLLASVSGFVASIPTILQSTFENIAKLLENIFANIQRFMTESSPKTMGAYRGATDRLAIDEFLGRISHEEFLRKQAALDKRYGMNATPVLMEGVDFGKTFADTQKFIDGIIEKIGKANLPETATGAPKPEGPVGTIADTAKATTDESNDLLFRIAKNTRDSADALTLRRETLGGGTMGAIGLTGAEVAAVNGSYGMFGNGLIPAGTDLERAMRRIIRDESRRNGQPGVMGRF
jgi:uncharacterized protein YukE